jgi:hypothetical protein
MIRAQQWTPKVRREPGQGEQCSSQMGRTGNRARDEHRLHEFAQRLLWVDFHVMQNPQGIWITSFFGGLPILIERGVLKQFAYEITV